MPMTDSPSDAEPEERAQMVGLLRHFAQVFGAGEVYREARAILLETPEGARILEEEYGRVRDEAQLDQDRQWPRSGRPGQSAKGKRAETALEEARRLLGG